MVVSARAYAKAVEVRNENEDLLLEDNYFDMNGGERRLKILGGTPNGLRVRVYTRSGRRIKADAGTCSRHPLCSAAETFRAVPVPGPGRSVVA